MVAGLAALLASAVGTVAGENCPANAVGFMKYQAGPGEMLALSYAFAVTPGPDGGKQASTIQNIMGEQLPSGTTVFVWNGAGGDYISSVYRTTTRDAKAVSGWLNPGLEILPGNGFWVRFPADLPAKASFTLTGTVPAAPSVTLAIVAGMNVLGYPYPVAVRWIDTALAQQAAVGDRIFLWQGQGYIDAEYRRTYDWGQGNYRDCWSRTDLMIPAGTAFWYQTTQPRLWKENKPYDWP